MTQVFTTFLVTSIIGSAMGAILMLLRNVTKKHFSAAWHYYMWLGVLVVMMLPVKINLPEMKPLEKTVENTITTEMVETNEVISNEAIVDTNKENTNNTQAIQHDFQSAENEVINKTENGREDNLLPEVKSEQKEKAITKTTESVPIGKEIADFLTGNLWLISYVWFFGMIMFFVLKAGNYILFIHKVKKNATEISCTRIMAYTTRKITVKECEEVTTPLVTGILKPILLLPKAELSTEQLDNILNHEMTHLNRHDILYKWFVSLVKCVHWFNPYVYFIGKQINIDCEISCDMAATKHLDKTGEKKYVDTILTLLSNQNLRTMPFTTQMAGDKKILKIRFERLKEKKIISKKMRAVSVVLASILCIATLVISGFLGTKVQIKHDLIERETIKTQVVNTPQTILLTKDKVTYDEIIRKYREAISEEWGPATLSSAGINEKIRYHFMSKPTFNIDASDPLETLGYIITDINSDGVDELIIGEMRGRIYEMYTLKDGSAQKIISSVFSDDWYMIKDADRYIFVQEDMIGRQIINVYYYTLENTRLNPIQAVMLSNPGGAEPWVMDTDDQDISYEEAQGIIDDYRELYSAPDFTPFGTVTDEEIVAKFYEAYDFWNMWVYGQVYRAYDSDIDYAYNLWRESITEDSPIQTAAELENEIRKHFATKLSETFIMQLSPEDKNGKLYVTCHDVGGSSTEIENIKIEKLNNRKYLMTFDKRTFYLASDDNVTSYALYCVLENGNWVFENTGETEFFYSHYVESAYDDGKFAPYNDVLKKYYSALWLDWNYDRLQEEDLSILASSGAASVQVGYCFMDVNGDNQAELLIGEVSRDKDFWSKIIYDMYTVKDGKPYRMFKSTPRDYYLLFEEDGEYKIANEVHLTNACTCYSYYKVGKSELLFEKAVIADLEASEENPWFMAFDDDHDTKNDTPIDEATALSIVEGAWLRYIAPEFVAFEY